MPIIYTCLSLRLFKDDIKLFFSESLFAKIIEKQRETWKQKTMTYTLQQVD